MSELSSVPVHKGNDYVCAECGCQQDSMDRPCDKCKSVRVVSVQFIESLMGPDWREKAFGTKSSDSNRP